MHDSNFQDNSCILDCHNVFTKTKCGSAIYLRTHLSQSKTEKMFKLFSIIWYAAFDTSKVVLTHRIHSESSAASWHILTLWAESLSEDLCFL